MPICWEILKLLKYLFFCSYVTFFIDIFVPNILIVKDTEIFKQTYLNSYHLDFSKPCQYIVINFIGLFYLRNNMLRKKDYFLLLIISVIFGFTSSIFVLTGQYDYEGFCSKNHLALLNEHKEDGELGFFVYKTMMDLQRGVGLGYYNNIFPNNIFSKKNIANDCVFPFYLERFTIKFFIYTVPYFAMLFISRFQCNFLRNRNYLKKFLNVLGYIFIFTNLVYQLIYFALENIYKFYFYLAMLVILVSGTVIQTILLRKFKRFHPRFYYFIMLLTPFISIHCLYYIILLSVSSAVVTIAASKSFPPVWAYKDERDLRTPVINIK
jgi:hypothetical protein